MATTEKQKIAAAESSVRRLDTPAAQIACRFHDGFGRLLPGGTSIRMKG